MPAPRRQKAPAVFQPVVLIPNAELTDLDRLAIARTYDTFQIVKLTMDTARSRQTRIGPSEFGDPCAKCLARKLAESSKIEGDNWKAQIGTFGHAGLEQHYLDTFPWMYDVSWLENEDAPGGWERIIEVKPDLVATDEQPLYHLERRVKVGEYGSRNPRVLDGSCDMFEQGATYGIVRDWKFQGESSLKKSGSGKIGQTYHTQMNGYGKGYEDLGFNVTHVQLFALPRDDEIDAAKPVLMRYDRQMAVDALERLTALVDAADVMRDLGLGWESIIDAQAGAPGCWDCPRFDHADERDFVAAL